MSCGKRECFAFTGDERCLTRLYGFRFYKRNVLSHRPGRDYLKRQQHMSASIRSILINWMLSVVNEFSEEFKLA